MSTNPGGKIRERLEKKRLAFCHRCRYNSQENFEGGERAMTIVCKTKYKAVPAIFVSIIDIVF